MTTPRITIIDYGMGNLQSVRNALARCGADADISDSPDDITTADALVLPGVGAFGEAMRNLRASGQADAIRAAVGDHVPLLGICLGMQLLAETSEERGTFEGLGILPGHVRRIPVPAGLRLPHMGWNTITFPRADPLFDGVEAGSAFYFVHTYELDGDSDDVIAHTDYGVPVVAAVRRDQVWATQFHPERSQSTGKALLRSFLDLATASAGSGAC